MKFATYSRCSAAVFAVAGLAKLADWGGARQAGDDFELPRWLAGPLRLALPLAELAVVGALLPRAAASSGAVGALGILLLFVAGIGSTWRGRPPDCHCFGQLQSALASGSALARNGLLALVADFAVWGKRADADPSAFAWLGRLPAPQVA